MTTPSHTPATALNITDAKFRLSDIKTLNIKQLQIKKGQSWAFVGANGSGKSALASALTGDLPPLSGQIETPFTHSIRISFEQLQK